jgi:WD40 repeat protein
MNTVKTATPQMGTQIAGDVIGVSQFPSGKPANPYVGPRTFTTQEREFFFGRDRESQDLLSVVIIERLVLFYAQSGAGKSSLINTRLIPGLIEEEYQVLPVGRLLGESVKKTDADNIYVYNLITSLIKRKVDESSVSRLTLSRFLAGLDYEAEQGYFYNESLAPEPSGDDRETDLKVVLIIDQFEELFTTHQEEWRKREDFFRQLAKALDDFPNLSIVLVMRDDYVAVLDPYVYLLPGKLRGRYYMQRLGHAAAREAVEGPAAKQNRPFVPEVAEKLVNDLSSVKVRMPNGNLELQPGQYVEPVQLQVICSSLWEKLDPKATRITQGLVEEYVGDVNTALGAYFSNRVHEVAAGLKDQSRDVSEYEIRQWFETRLITSDGIRNMVAQVPGGKSGGLEDSIVQEFVRRGDLVRAEKRGGAAFYELTHDRLIEPILQNNREWFENESDLIQKRVAVWLQQGRSTSFLLRGKDLRTARELAKTRTPTEDEKTYIAISTRQERTRTIAWVAVGVTLLVMTTLTFLALQASDRAVVERQNAVLQEQIAATNASMASKNEEKAKEREEEARKSAKDAEIALEQAEEAKKIAEAQRSAARAQIYQNRGDLYMSTLLAIDSWSKQPSPEVEEILRENISFLPRPVATFDHLGAISLLEFNPDGRTFAAAGYDGSVCVRNVETETELFCRTASTPVNDMVFSSDGSILITGDALGKLTVLDGEKGNVITEHDFGSESPVLFLDIGPDGKTILIARENGNIRILDIEEYLQNPREIGYLLETETKPSVSVFSPDGKWVAAGTEGGSVIYWNLSSGYRYSRGNHAGKILALRFSPDGKYLVSGGEDNYAVIVSTRAERAMQSLPHLGPVRDIAFGPDSSWFVTASDDQRVRIWDVPGMERFRILQEGGAPRLMISPNGQLITTLGADGTIRAWNAATGQEVFQIPLDVTTSMVAFSRDGKYLVSGDQQGGLSVWDIFTLATPAKAVLLSGIAETIQYNSAGALALSDEKKVWVLPPESLEDLSELPLTTVLTEAQFPARVNRVVLSPDSSYLGFTTEKNDVGIINLYNMSGMGQTLLRPLGTVQDIAFTSDSWRLITLDSEGRVQGWDTGSRPAGPTGGREFPFPDSFDFTQKGSGASSINTGPGILAVAVTGKILIMDTTSGKLLSETDAPGEHNLLAFNADGSLLADGNSYGTINLWRQEAGRLTFEKNFDKDFDKPRIVSIALSPDGKLLAVGTAENVHLIDIQSSQEIARIPHVDTVNDLSFSPDGKTLVSASADLIQFWDIGNIQTINRDDLVPEACSRMVKNLDKSQWAALFGEEEYRPLCENLPVP